MPSQIFPLIACRVNPCLMLVSYSIVGLGDWLVLYTNPTTNSFCIQSYPIFIPQFHSLSGILHHEQTLFFSWINFLVPPHPCPQQLGFSFFQFVKPVSSYALFSIFQNFVDISHMWLSPFPFFLYLSFLGGMEVSAYIHEFAFIL